MHLGRTNFLRWMRNWFPRGKSILSSGQAFCSLDGGGRGGGGSCIQALAELTSLPALPLSYTRRKRRTHNNPRGCVMKQVIRHLVLLAILGPGGLTSSSGGRSSPAQEVSNEVQIRGRVGTRFEGYQSIINNVACMQR